MINVICSICKWEGREFRGFGVVKRPNAKCPQCGSLERHRLYYMYLKDILSDDIKVLHVAPEKCLIGLFNLFTGIERVCVNLSGRHNTIREDIQDMTFDDNSFNIIICSHVLEHVDDDIAAMREFFRVLKPGGVAMLQVPIKNIEKTYEDKSITSPKDRELVFGQRDHVRIYGEDYVDRLESVGFDVEIDDFYYSFNDYDQAKFGLLEENIYLCKK